jgi:hypothetical protein
MQFDIVDRHGAESCCLDDLRSCSYLLAGLGGYSQVILQRLKQRQLAQPDALVDTMMSGCREKFGLPVLSMSEAASLSDKLIIIGSSPYDFESELINKLRLHGCNHLICLAPEEIFEPFNDPYHTSPIDEQTWPIVLLICMLDHHIQQLMCLINLLRQQKIQCRIVRPYDAYAITRLDQSQVLGAILWNGTPTYYESVKQYLDEHGKPFLYAELGFFPQRDHVYLDRQGVNLARSMELPNEKRVEAEQELSNLRANLLAGREWIPTDYVLIPLQIASDTNVRLYSDYGDRIQQFIDDVIRDHGHERLLFKPHPLDPMAGTYDFYGYNVVNGDFMTLALSCKFICGINSSTLFEARLVGIPVHFYGRSLLSETHDEYEVMLRMVQNQFRVDGSDLTRKIGPYMNLFGIEI